MMKCELSLGDIINPDISLYYSIIYMYLFIFITLLFIILILRMMIMYAAPVLLNHDEDAF
jgi:hypothetical protein